jgi:ATP phosphoribosyltransferase regulatory subunit
LYGEAGAAADIEVIELFLETLRAAGVNQVYLDLGHVDIYRGLLAGVNLSVDQETILFDLLQRKALKELNQWVSANIADSKIAYWLNLLPTLTGGPDILADAKLALAGAPSKVLEAITRLELIVATLTDTDVTLYLDLGELSGYHYHTGVVFSAYTQGYGKALGNGGRYDHIGEVFGRPRPATGFAFDLKSLVAEGTVVRDNEAGIFVAADIIDSACRARIAQLRNQGFRVVQGFIGQQLNDQELHCDRQLVKKGDQYMVIEWT